MRYKVIRIIFATSLFFFELFGYARLGIHRWPIHFDQHFDYRSWLTHLFTISTQILADASLGRALPTTSHRMYMLRKRDSSEEKKDKCPLDRQLQEKRPFKESEEELKG
ncbi:hypothetical protein QVD17_06969 [Tagetes erecta]|uniref:Uncharacterized protein n=1 Tax=Tagetes erecta TaxID=13708 RepID=A0AAD8LLP1_TARER|nr:hypothetical protein QVD17_06969 [Tagetes erecta]